METVTEIFKTRLRNLRISSNKSQEELANALGISRGAVSYYEKGSRVPDINILNNIAEYFHVTCDYLLGISDIPQPDIEKQAISELTGLSDASISELKLLKETSIPQNGVDYETAVSRLLLLETINVIIESHADGLLHHLACYFFAHFTHFGNFYDEHGKLSPISELELYDKSLNIAVSEDYDFLSDSFLLMIQKDLTYIRDLHYHNLTFKLHTSLTGETPERSYKIIQNFLKAKSKRDNPFE